MSERLFYLINNKEFGKAKRLLKKELEKNATDVYLLTQMANVLWNLGKNEEALAYSNKALASDSYYPLMLFTRGRVLGSLGKYEEAMEMWDRLLHAELTDVAKRGWGIRWAKSVVNDARFYKALCLSELRQMKEAKALMEEHLAIRRTGQESDFTVKEARTFLRYLTYCSGKPLAFEGEENGWASPKQWAYMEKMFAKKENDKPALVAYMKKKSREFPYEYYLKTLLAEHLIDLDRYEEALRYAHEAYCQEPTDMLVVYDYGNALFNNGKYKEAKQVLEVILHTDINIIAYGDHSEGMRWAKTLLKDAEKIIELCANHDYGKIQ